MASGGEVRVVTNSRPMVAFKFCKPDKSRVAMCEPAVPWPRRTTKLPRPFKTKLPPPLIAAGAWVVDAGALAALPAKTKVVPAAPLPLIVRVCPAGMTVVCCEPLFQSYVNELFVRELTLLVFAKPAPIFPNIRSLAVPGTAAGFQLVATDQLPPAASFHVAAAARAD